MLIVDVVILWIYILIYCAYWYIMLDNVVFESEMVLLRKKFRTLLCGLMILSIVTAVYTCPVMAVEDTEFSYIQEESGITITRYNGSDVQVTIPQTIDGIAVTKISRDTFHLSSIEVETVSVPASVSKIETRAFYKLNSLREVSIDPENQYYSSEDGVFFNKDKTVLLQYPISKPEAAYKTPDNVSVIADVSFYGCKYISSVTLSDNMETIGDHAFGHCPELTAMNIPKTVSYIMGLPFVGCGSLSEINVDIENVYYTSEDGVLFNKDKTILMKYPPANTRNVYLMPATVETISEASFLNSDFLDYVVISPHVVSVNDSAFLGCQRLKRTDVLIEGQYSECFDGKTMPSVIQFPDSTEKIGSSAFSDCNSIEKIRIGEKTSYIGNEAFVSCGDLTEIDVAADNPTYASENGIFFNKEKTSLVLYPNNRSEADYSVPESVTRIEPYAFRFCKWLQNIFTGNSTEYIGAYAFEGCSTLKNVTMSDQLKIIESGAFYNCSNLISAVTGKSLSLIGDNAFQSCGSLERISITVDNVKINDQAFYSCPSLTIYGHSGSAVQSYAQANGIAFSDVSNTGVSINNVLRNTADKTMRAVFTNYSGNGIAAPVAVCAVYNGKRLKDIKMAPIDNLEDGAIITVDFLLDEISPYYTYNILMWNNLQQMEPVCLGASFL